MVSTAEAFSWFDAAHETGVPDDSAVFTLVCAETHPPETVYAALLEDARLHRVRLSMGVLRRLRRPAAGCFECRASGAVRLAGGQFSLCHECMDGRLARYWVTFGP